ncbi:hypothetical protein [Methylobacterium sp. A54F]
MKNARTICMQNARLLQDMREIIEQTRCTVRNSQDLLRRLEDAHRANPLPGSGPLPAACTLQDPTESVADALLEAHRRASGEEDRVLKDLIAQALWHVGQRLAHQAGPRALGVRLH